MRLEEAVSKIESIVKYKQTGVDGLTYLNDKIKFMNDYEGVEKEQLQDKLHETLLIHHDFYNHIDCLYAFAKSSPPNPRAYGRKAEKWLRTHKTTNYSFWTTMGGFGVTIVGLISNASVLGIPVSSAGMTGLAVGGVVAQCCNVRAEGLANDEDVSTYIKDLATYFARGKQFKRTKIKFFDKLRFFEDSMNSYLDSLKKLTDNFEGEFTSDLTNNYIELQSFKKDYIDIIQTIRKNKKYPTVGWIGEMGSAVIAAEFELDKNHIENAIANLRRSNSDLVSE